MNSYDRDKLYKQVWERPVSSVAKEYGVSDTAIAKACRRLCVPLPPRGYWAKVHAGQSPEIPALPEYASSEKATYKPAIDESASFSKEHHHPSAQKTVAKPVYNDDALKKQVNAFLHCCISDNGIMVRCNANDLYLQLMNENRLGIDESILRRFRDDERNTVMIIMDMLSVTEFVTSSQIRDRLSRPKASVARLLSKMCDEGLLQAVGAGRATKYQKSAHFS